MVEPPLESNCMAAKQTHNLSTGPPLTPGTGRMEGLAGSGLCLQIGKIGRGIQILVLLGLFNEN